jgi:hypothetical protein
MPGTGTGAFRDRRPARLQLRAWARGIAGTADWSPQLGASVLNLTLEPLAK